MRRLLRPLTTAVLVLGSSACSGTPPLEDPDFVIAPADLARALVAERSAALARYDGKLLQLSGTVGKKVQPGGLNPTLGVSFASIDAQLAFESDISFVSFDPEDPASRSDFDDLSVGDETTLLCRFRRLNESGTLISVGGCRVVGG